MKRGRAGSRAVPLLAQRAASEGPRWTRAVWLTPATCPKRPTGHGEGEGRRGRPDGKWSLDARSRGQFSTSHVDSPAAVDASPIKILQLTQKHLRHI